LEPSVYHYDKHGNRNENITDWALEQFRSNYPDGSGKRGQPITKKAIFQYVYAVLHDPVYRDKYALNLAREFPRIPFYPHFWQWSDWGKMLVKLHIEYEQARSFPLKRLDVLDEKARETGHTPKPTLKVDKQAGAIVIDTETVLTGIPSEAWEYKLANRSALEWVLDQYKERTPKDKTIREKFNTYRFADYKENVVELIKKVTTVSVETVRIVRAMQAANRN
jgi:predicted helicase